MSEHVRVIEALGGTAAVARLCCVTTQAVSGWRRKGIPPARLMYLKVIRPDAVGSLTPERKRRLPKEQRCGQ